MSIQTEITRIQTARNLLRTKAVSLGIGTSTDDLTSLSNKYDGITDQGTPSAEVKEGESYTLTAGYYHGGTIKGVSGGGNYNLQNKTVTPTKAEQVVDNDAGYYGLDYVTVNPIPDIYQDVSSVDATATDVLVGKTIVTANGTLTAGTMANNGAVTKALDCGESYTVPEGYHSGAGTVTANSLASQTGVDDGKTAVTAAYMLTGTQAWVNGAKVSGTMAINGAISGTITGLGSVTGDTSYTIPAGYTSGGTVSLTSDIETALAAI